MRHTATLLLAALCLGAPAAVRAQDAWLPRAERLLNATPAARGQRLFDRPLSGSVNEGAKYDIDILIPIGTPYRITGVCDTGCADVDLELYDAFGKLVARDVDPNEAPVVSVTPRMIARYMVRVRMVRCVSQPCRFFVGVFVPSHSTAQPIR